MYGYHRCKDVLSRYQTVIFRTVFLLFLGIWSGIKLWYLMTYSPDQIYTSWGLSDYLINYEGGFIRRGLLGQLLYWVAPYHVVDTIVGLYMLFFVILAYFTVRLFIKEGWSIVILISPICFSCFFRTHELFIELRKDYLLLLLTLCLFQLYSKYSDSRKTRYLVTFHIISVIQLLIHEASFFFTTAILLFLAGSDAYNKTKSGSTALKSMIILGLPALCSMTAVCIAKGNEQIATAIWESWSPYYAQYPSIENYQSLPSIQALTWGTTDTFHKHLLQNWGTVRTFIRLVFNFICTYWLITKLNTVDLKWYKLKPFDRIQLSNILLIQFVLMIPMFTILSCDLYRTIPYWSFSTFFAFHYFKDQALFPQCITRLSHLLQKGLYKCKYLNNPSLYLLCAIFIPIQFGSVYILFYKLISLSTWYDLMLKRFFSL